MPASSGIHRNGAVVTRRREVAGERPAIWIRLRARLQRLSLDHRLATGEPAWASAELRWRAAQLTSPRAWRGLAEEIDRLLEVVAQPPRPRGAAAPLVRQLLRDGGSPLYAADEEGALDGSIRRARAALLLD
jgi:hypothetical protein